MSGYNPREIPEYVPRRDAVRAKDLNDIVKRLKRLEKLQVQWPLQLINHSNNPILTLDDDDSEPFGYYYNDGSQDVTPFGICAVTGWHSTKIIKAKRPSSTFYVNYIVDIGEGCEVGRIGKYQKQEEKIFLYDDGETPTFDQWWGPYPDTFEATKYLHTFNILGIESASPNLARGYYHPIHKVRGKTDGSAHAKGSNFDLAIYDAADAIITGWEVSVNNDYIDIPAEELWVHATLIAGLWELSGLECSA